MNWSTRALLALPLLVVSTFSAPALASEGGSNNYSNGNTDLLSGAILPPKPNSLLLVGAALYYSSDALKDGNGNTLTPPSFEASVKGVGGLLIYNWGRRFLGAKVGSEVSAYVANVRLDGLGLACNSVTGISDITISPLVLTWDPGRLHIAAITDIVVPVGTYDRTRAVNVGYHYATIRPSVSISYLSRSGLEISSRHNIDFNFKNPATNYRSGTAYHVDFNVSQAVGFWKLGVAGYYFQQLTDDKINGAKFVADGYRGRVFGIGPTLNLNTPAAGFYLRVQKEFGARNRLQGAQVILDVTHHF
jgi:hypothetical protein